MESQGRRVGELDKEGGRARNTATYKNQGAVIHSYLCTSYRRWVPEVTTNGQSLSSPETTNSTPWLESPPALFAQLHLRLSYPSSRRHPPAAVIHAMDAMPCTSHAAAIFVTCMYVSRYLPTHSPHRVVVDGTTETPHTHTLSLTPSFSFTHHQKAAVQQDIGMSIGHLWPVGTSKQLEARLYVHTVQSINQITNTPLRRYITPLPNTLGFSLFSPFFNPTTVASRQTSPRRSGTSPTFARWL